MSLPRLTLRTLWPDAGAHRSSRIPCEGSEPQVPTGHLAMHRWLAGNVWIPDPSAFLVALLEVR